MKPEFRAGGEPHREEIPMQTRLASVSSANAETRTVTLVWTTGADVTRFDWWEGTRYIERLRVDASSCHLDRLNSGAPLLDSHNRYELSNQIGVVERAWIDGANGMAEVRFPKEGVDANADRVFALVQDGIVRNVSVGYSVARYEIEKNNGNGLDVWTAVDWTPLELSLVTVPADAGAGVRSADHERKHVCEFVVREMPAAKKESTMDELNTVKPGAAPAATETETRIAPVTPVVVRFTSTEAIDFVEQARAFGVDEQARNLVSQNERGEVGVEQCRSQILAAAAEKQRAASVTVPATAAARVTVDEHETLRNAISAAVLHRASQRHGIGKFDLPEESREYRGFELTRIAEEVLRANGVNVRGMTQPEICQRAITTSDFVGILANVTNKSLQSGYGAEPRTFLPFCTQRNASDFKTMYSNQFGEGSDLDEVKEDGVYTYASVGEAKESWKLRKFGKIFPITWETILNDDLGAFSRVPYNFGQGAVRKENDIIWGFFIDNPNMADGKALFHADHKNYIEGADTNLAILKGLDGMRKLFRQQKGLDGKKRLNLRLRYIMVGSALETTLEQILSPMLYAGSSSAIVPEFYRSLVPIVESRLDDLAVAPTTAFFGAADPGQIATIEYGYLDGQQGIYLETREGFERDGVEFKARHVFGGAPVNHRGLAKSKGAA